MPIAWTVGSSPTPPNDQERANVSLGVPFSGMEKSRITFAQGQTRLYISVWTPLIILKIALTKLVAFFFVFFLASVMLMVVVVSAL